MHLARDGVDVIITYRSHAEEAEAVVASIADLGRVAVALQLDAGIIESFDAFITSMGDALRTTWSRETFDFLVNNAGMQIPGSFATATPEDFDRLIAVHFKGIFFLTQRLAGLLAENGSIVNISSGHTRFYTPECVIYAAAKGAIEVLTRYLAQELGPRGITVNTIAPGAVATDYTDRLLRDKEEVQHMINSLTPLGRYAVADDIGGAIAALLSDGLLRDTEQVQQMISSLVPLGRYTVADDIGGAIAALLGDGNRWVTGQRIEVSGGLHL
jgi:NAD(P)-dependent dehydrogenase (short-subunit alcohol dehydrogenase family)